jgi:deoxyribonuclease-4
MWLIGSSKVPYDIKDNIHAIREIKSKFGLDTWELATIRKIDYSDKTVSNMLQASKDTNTPLSLHGEIYSGVLCNPDKTWDDIVRFVGNSLFYARDLNCRVILHPGGSYHGELMPQIELVMSRLDKIIQYTGIRPEQIYLETTGKIREFGNFPEVYYISKIMGTRICTDFAHLYARRLGDMPLEYVQSVISYLESFPWFNDQHIHISGMQFNKHGEYKHMPIQSSGFDYRMVLNELKKSKLSGRIIVESGFEYCQDAQHVKQYLG